MSTFGNVTVFHEDTYSLGLAGAAMNTDTNAVESAGVDAHELGGALLVPSAAPVSAESTAGIDPNLRDRGWAQAQNATARGHKRRGRRMHDVLPRNNVTRGREWTGQRGG